ncbi:MAG: hypothetical protein F6K39_43820 [Okeania sp. SIO3B3]|nr:hypothetical protein [Okeania sp. SIO3B3]
MVEGRQRELEAGGRRFSQECHLNFIHAPMLPDMISGGEKFINIWALVKRVYDINRALLRSHIMFG